ncbi:MAG: DUF4398 domain-containing protein [bacterium]|nr:DUF4398 domain-containing protein [candidate division KSB1 bacterium]MDH7561375.1 DUF4398 domain-containing protein [bacterium]
MRSRMVLPLVAVVAVLALVAGCAKAPDPERIDAVKAALQAAKAAEADRYVPQQYAAANDSLNAALAEIEKQNGKFAPFRKYGVAEHLLQVAEEKAKEAAQAAAVKREEVKNEATALIQQVTDATAQVKKLFAKAPRGKEGRQALELIKSDIGVVDNTVAEANAAMEKGDYLTARDKAKAALDKANALINELQEVISKKAALTKKR